MLVVGIGCVRESVFVMLQGGGSRYFFLASRESFVFHCGTCIHFVVLIVIFVLLGSRHSFVLVCSKS